ncbi:MAG: nucleoside triphosphate pyrophosphohydrolase [Bacteroidota bacterium]
MNTHTFKFDKLVRDKVCQILDKKGAEVSLVETLTRSDIIRYFKHKLLEEAAEVCEAQAEEEIVRELVDCIEVIHGFTKSLGISQKNFEAIKLEKLSSGGGFQDCTVVSTVTIPEGSPLIDYYLQNQAKYPKVDTHSSQ